MSASSSSSPGRGGGGSKKKTRRKRSNISGEILECLEKFFESQPHPDGQERRQLALEIGETENLVRIWFQNRRAKNRRVRSQLMYSQEEEMSTTTTQQFEEFEDEDPNNITEEDIIKELASKSPKILTSSSRSPARTIPNSSRRRKNRKTSSSCDENNVNSSSIVFPSERNTHSSVQPKPQSSSQPGLGETPLMLDVHLYPRILTRIIGMVAAGESILKESDADFYESLKDAHYGILLKDNKKLLYNKVYGLHVVDSL